MVANAAGRKALNERTNSSKMLSVDEEPRKLLSDDNNPKQPIAYEANRYENL